MKSARVNMKSLVLATVASGVTMWLLAGLWHLVIVPGFYSGGVGAEHHEGGWMISVGYLLLATVMATMFSMWSRSERPVYEGIRFGLLVGLLWVTPHALVRAGAHGGGHGASISYLLINGAWHLVEQGFGGLIIGSILGVGSPARRSVNADCCSK